MIDDVYSILIDHNQKQCSQLYDFSEIKQKMLHCTFFFITWYMVEGLSLN